MGDIVKTLAGKNDLKAGVVPSVFPWVRTSPRNRKEPTVRNMEISQNSENKPPYISPPPPHPSGLYLEIALKYKVKQSKDGRFPSNYKASLIDFETQIQFLSLDNPLQK